MKNRIVLAAAIVSLVLTGALVVRVIAIGKPGVVVILLPALAGGLLPLWKHGRTVLIAATLLTAVTAVVSLIGGVGLLYFPSIVVFTWAVLSPSRVAAPTRAA